MYIRRRDHSWLRRHCTASEMIHTSLPRGFVWSLLLTYQNLSAIVLAWRISSFFTFLCKGYFGPSSIFFILFWCIHFNFTKIYNHFMTPFKLILSTMDVRYGNFEVSFLYILMSWQLMSCVTQSGKALSMSSSHRDINSCTLSTDINIYEFVFFLIFILLDQYPWHRFIIVMQLLWPYVITYLNLCALLTDHMWPIGCLDWYYFIQNAYFCFFIDDKRNISVDHLSRALWFLFRD